MRIKCKFNVLARVTVNMDKDNFILEALQKCTVYVAHAKALVVI